MSRPMLFNALIRTHHITSRKKLTRVRKDALQLNVDYLLVRSGGSPGIMYAESLATSPDSLAEWVAAVQSLRYKDFRCAQKPAPAEGDGRLLEKGVVEMQSVGDFGREMERRGLAGWWRRGMGYEGEG